MQYKDYYKIMGLQRNATTNQIKHAYRKLAHKYHPDISNAADAEEKFKEVGEAYKILKNPKKRAVYDLLEDQLDANWQTSHQPKPPTPPPNQEFQLPRIVIVVGILIIILLFATLLRPFGVPITILLMIYLFSLF